MGGVIMKKIKVALCYSGAVRGLINNLPQIHDVLFNEEIYEIDYYLYADPNGGTVHAEDVAKGKIEPQGLKVQKELPYFNCLLESELDGFRERKERFYENILDYHMPYEQQIHQWYGVKRVFEFVFSQEKEYDVYVRLRCDLYPAGKMKFDWDKFDANTVYVPFNCPFGGINDRFAFGSKNAMKIYSNFYDSDIYYSSASKDGASEQKGIAWYEKNYQHIPTDNFGNQRKNSEYRLLNYLFDKDLEIELLPPENLSIAAVRNSAGIIRYGGPEVEELLFRHNQAKLEDLKYHKKPWWR